MGFLDAIKRLLDPTEPVDDPEFVALKEALDAYMESTRRFLDDRRKGRFVDDFSPLVYNYIRHPDGRRELLANILPGEYGRAIAKTCLKLLRDSRCWQMARDRGIDVETLNAFWSIPVAMYKDIDEAIRDAGIEVRDAPKIRRSFAEKVMGDPDLCWKTCHEKGSIEAARSELILKVSGRNKRDRIRNGQAAQ